MKVTLERLPESRVQLDIEVDQDRVDKSFEAAYRKMASRARVPGFRPGKAPRQMIERALGHDRIMGEALDDLVPKVYEEAAKEQPFDAIDRPALDKVEFEPVRLSFIIPVRPTVDLGEYRALRIDKTRREVTDEMVAERILRLRRDNAILEPVDRPAIVSDTVGVDIVGTLDGEEVLKQDDGQFAIREDGHLAVVGLLESFVGMSSGETKEVVLTFPDDSPRESLRAKAVTFTITMNQVRQETLPDEDEEFAASVNEEFNSVDELKNRIKDNLQHTWDHEDDEAYRSQAVDALVTGATLDFPALLIEREMDNLLREATGGDRNQYLQYLQRVGRTDAEFRESFRLAAEIRVRRSLCLFKLSDAESIDVTPDEVTGEIDRLAQSMGEDADRFRKILESGESRSNIRNNLISDRTLQRLVAIVTGEAPAAPVEEDAPADAGATEGEAE